MSAFDVWVVRFDPGETSPAERLQRAFGLDASSAAALEQSLPKIVKHAVPAKTAGEMRQALEAIGAVVECRPARATKTSAPADAPAVFPVPDRGPRAARAGLGDRPVRTGFGREPAANIRRTITCCRPSHDLTSKLPTDVGNQAPRRTPLAPPYSPRPSLSNGAGFFGRRLAPL